MGDIEHLSIVPTVLGSLSSLPNGPRWSLVLRDVLENRLLRETSCKRASACGAPPGAVVMKQERSFGFPLSSALHDMGGSSRATPLPILTL